MRAVGLGAMPRLRANHIAKYLNNHKKSKDDVGVDTQIKSFVENLPPAAVSSEVGSEQAKLFDDSMKKKSSPAATNWQFNLMLGLVCVAPLAMFAALGGKSMVCGEHDERNCSKVTQVFVEAIFVIFFVIGSVALTGAFTAF